MIYFILSLILGAWSQENTSQQIKLLDHKITNETEISMIVAKGNTNSKTTTAKEKLSLTKLKNTYSLQAKYLRTKTDNIESGKSWLLGLRYERAINTHISAFLGLLSERDTYAGYARRNSLDLGGKYYFIQSEKKHILFAELNYRYTKETDLNDHNENRSYIRSYLEWEKSWHQDLSTKVWSEYLYDTDDSKKYFVTSEVSTSFVLSAIISLKLAYLNKYINQPLVVGIDKMDELYTTTLVAKF